MKKITSLILGLMVILPLSVAPALASSDTSAPSRPLGLTSSVVSPNQINLNWLASTDNVGVTGYNIYNKNILIGTATTTNFSNIGLTANTKYKYRINAYDAAGNISHRSVKLTATTLANPDITSPSIPANLAAVVVSSKQINLNWTKATDDTKVTGYNIYRNSILIATSSKSMFKDTGLASSTVYTYNVSAFDAKNNVSAKSVSILAITLAPDTISPSAPSALIAKIINLKNKIMLSWTASTDNVAVTGYQITRNGLTLGTSKDTKYIDKNVAPNTAYAYSVIALDADGNTSATSSIVSITTPATASPIKKDELKKEHKENVAKDHKDNDNSKSNKNDKN